jgi:uncharacterized membrane-anchored protein
MRFMSFAAAAALSMCCSFAAAQEADPAAAYEQQLASLAFRDGPQALASANAVLQLDPQFRFLGQADARRVLEEFWGNPPDADVLGMVVPAGMSLADEGSWVAVVTYSDEGYVSDEDASSIDYDALLQEMKDGTAEENEARREAGYPTVELVGWASPPRYDAASRKLHWAKELAFEGSDGHTVNYDVRVLGRRGYLSLNAVGERAQLDAMQAGMQRLIPQVEFNPGERYADFDESTDQVAAYGLAALVGGTLAAKTGLLGKLLALLIAAKKIVIPLAIGAGALLLRWFKRKSDSPAA